MLSRFFHSVRIYPNIFAIYNTLIMDVYYVDEKELNMIVNETLKDIDMLNLLFKSGIYVKSPKHDEEALDYLLKTQTNITGKVDILYLILTQNCNLSCSYCFLNNNPNHTLTYNQMNYKIAKESIDKFSTYLKNNSIEESTIVFYGGEPLLNKTCFTDSVNYIRKNIDNCNISIITNGTLIDNEIASFIKDNNVIVGLSIDGPKEIHNTNRKYKHTNLPSYNDVILSKKILEKNQCKYGFSMVISNDMLANKAYVMDWIFENSNSNVFFNLLHFSKMDALNTDYIEKASNFLFEFYEENEKRDANCFDGRLQRQIDSIKNQQFAFSDCGAVGCHQITILPNGEVCICHGDSVDNKYFIGNIQTMEIQELINSVQNNFWKSYSTLNDNECLSCEALFCCGKGCPHHSGILTGNRNSKDENYCNYVKNSLVWNLRRGYFST